MENLQHGLLNQAVDDTGDAEFPDPAIRLRDFNPLNRLRPIVPVEQLRPNVWPVLTQERLRFVDGHPINAGASFVPFNTLPRSFEVLSVAPSAISCSVKAEFSVADFAMNGSVSPSPHAGASPRSFGSKASTCWLFCRFLFTRYQSYLLSQSFGPSAIVSGSAYLFLHLSALECLNSFADSLS
ncbi:hypothetical protein [Bradyrhizobium barranii]|uniref:hypothetical protein n=1 Tax=Bradyrhizobium barranii TaxID=2992140 RepID=UPI003CCAE84D